MYKLYLASEKEWKEWAVDKNMIEETEKPYSFPCVVVWYEKDIEGYGGVDYYAEYVYLNDFQK